MIITKLRDVYIPQVCRTCKIARINVPKNPYDILLFQHGIYLILELKSGKQKSFSLDEKIIKEHQIKNLNKYKDYKNVFPGFIFNFVNYDNQTYFLHINDFNYYLEHPTQKSIPLEYIKENGLKIENKIKIKKYKYDLEKLINDIIEKYNVKIE
jgi:penicillin-binding protein-related factor A (putative recombinase)